MSLERDVFAMLADNAEVFTRGRHDRAALSKLDMFRFDRIVASHMSLDYSGFVLFEERLIDEEAQDADLNAVGAYMVHPGFRAGWDASKPGYPESFRELIHSKAIAAM